MVLLDQGRLYIEHVVVYSDSINALDIFQRSGTHTRATKTVIQSTLLREAISTTKELDALGVRVELRRNFAE